MFSLFYLLSSGSLSITCKVKISMTQICEGSTPSCSKITKNISNRISQRKESLMTTSSRNNQAVMDRLAEISQRKESIMISDQRDNQGEILTVWSGS